MSQVKSFELIVVFSKEITIYQCGLCCAEFSSKPQLQEHVSEAHDEEEEQNTKQGKSLTAFISMCDDWMEQPDL